MDLTSTALSIFVFSIYEILTGLGFLFFPNRSFKLFKIDETHEPWIKVVGAVAFLSIGYYNLMIAQLGIESIYWPSINARLGLVFIIIFLVNFQKAPKSIYLLW